MDLIVISHPKIQENEIQEVGRMFELGLKTFHIRKPHMSRRELTEYIKHFPRRYRKKLILHSYHSLADQFKLGGIHLSRTHRKRTRFYQFRLWLKRRLYPDMIVTRTFHKLTDITGENRTYTYTFLSPVFDSVSHNTLAGGYSKRALLVTLPQARQNVYAMGGIKVDNLHEVADLGFQGAAFLGSLWRGPEPPHVIFKKALAEAKAIAVQRSES